MILAIDPGNEQSAYVVIDKDLTPIQFAKVENLELMELIKSGEFKDCDHLAIEMIASYGMAVGKTVFETCVWIGRYMELLESQHGLKATWVYRRDVKMNLCNSTRAKDSNVTQALVDRFAPYTRNKGKGTKKEPGFFYGFKADIWAAYAVGVTYADKKMNLSKNRVVERKPK